MGAMVPVPREALEALTAFRFPSKLDRHMQGLMDRNNDGLLTPGERDELEGLVELSEDLAIQRAQVQSLLTHSASC